MGDLVNDRRAVVRLVIKEYLKLSKSAPRHELLQYIANVSNHNLEYAHNKMVQQEFFKKYAPENVVPVSVMLARYYIDLRNAVDKIEGIDRSNPKTIKRIFKNEKTGNLEDKFF